MIQEQQQQIQLFDQVAASRRRMNAGLFSGEQRRPLLLQSIEIEEPILSIVLEPHTTELSKHRATYEVLYERQNDYMREAVRSHIVGRSDHE